uniref:BLOC-1-related complex subunit 6 C-terminal helix domain-containing protein n=1 Tax=Trichobilharzia regenti TaxID=157069 RepID=A0AA85K9R5_TRIRE|nr:unnamed protein product [Trichobilharzia regenti]
MVELHLSILPKLEKDAEAVVRRIDVLLASLKSSLSQEEALMKFGYFSSMEMSTYVLMAKCEELSKSVSQLEPLKKEIESIKRTLSKFEETLFTSSK